MADPARRYPLRFPACVLAAIAGATAASHAAPWGLPSGGPPPQGRCANPGVYVFVGGTGGFNALRQGDMIQALLATGHVGLYQHATAIGAASEHPGLLHAIERVFSGTGPGQAELGQVGANYFTLPPSYGYYQAQYIQNGLRPTEANVNTPFDSAPPGQLASRIRQWDQYVDAARTAGLRSVAPVTGPNSRGEPKLGDNVFATHPFYALERAEAIYGKAIAFDVPPNFFLGGGSGPGYQKFIVQAIQWGNANGLRTTMLVSPYPWPTNKAGKLERFRQFTGNTFFQDTQTFVKYLAARGAIPTEWSVDNYEDTYPDDAPAMIPDTQVNTTTQVGLWLAGNAPVSCPSS